MKISDIQTPALLLDSAKLDRNSRRMAERIAALGCRLRPHVKTHKSIDVLERVRAAGDTGGITVSTLHEADYFFERGVTDIFYAVGIAPNKFDAAASLMERGCELRITLDSVEMAGLVAADGERRARPFDVVIELDTDGHRSGILPGSDELLEIGRLLDESGGTILSGVMTHAGGSYACAAPDALLQIARQERDGAVLAAGRLRDAGFPCPLVSVGSTPTALSIDDLSGVTEVRAGVYVFFDLVMAGIGVCGIDDIALSVLTSVIGHQGRKNRVITDGGWMAMSRDRGTADQQTDQGYGLVYDGDGRSAGDLVVVGANQEHGIVSTRDSKRPLDYEKLALGTLLRVLPNHACATAGQYDRYHLLDGDEPVGEWPRTNGW